MPDKISVITVVFNSKKSLEQTILSVINQRYSNIEYIIIDGGSTDGTVEVIKRYQEHIAFWVSENDGGIYDAMNKGLSHVNGDWVYFLGAGDILLNVIDKTIPQLKSKKHIYYGNVYRTDLLKVFNGWFSMFRSSRMSICHQAIIYPVDAVKKYKFNTNYKVQADHNLNMQLYGDKEYKYEFLDIIFCIYEGDGFSAVTRDNTFFANRLKIVKTNFPWFVYFYALAVDLACKIAKRGEYRQLK